ncbi:hypothetical protein [Diatraea saccharalis granulovirus]|uniref:Uncharacterized protein n=1 Tax=Diatraea saccharalis granulovirus TaxID=1675862 RepID=A0A0R7EYX0_9BBAC|nr:hypothetical protein [Diatraea saccharalis granulovirus]AKN80788.1 hypothetical protein [Diatraea saccharalis granulovirus]
MEKKVNVLQKSFESWVEEEKKKYSSDKTTLGLIKTIEENVLTMMEEKQKKFIKIDNLNKVLYGIK